MLVSWVRIVPAGLEFLKGDGIWRIAIDFVRAHVHEGTPRAGLACGLEEIERTHGIRVEIIKGDRRRAVTGRLGRSVNKHIRSHQLDQIQHALPIANIHLMVSKAEQLSRKPLLVPACITLWSKKESALVVVHPMHDVAEFMGEIDTCLRADQARRSGDE